MNNLSRRRVLTAMADARGDVDATIGQFGFNIAQMLIPVALLAGVGVPAQFSLTHLVPGFSVGFLVGSVGLTLLAWRLGRARGRHATVHAYGSSVPAIVAFVSAIFMPVLDRTGDMSRAWSATAAAVMICGVLKVVVAPISGLVARHVPAPAITAVFGAAMYSFLALTLLPRLLDQPTVGLIALGIVIATQFAGLRITKWNVPPFLAAWLIPLAVGAALGQTHIATPILEIQVPFIFPPEIGMGFADAFSYLPVILPIAAYVILQNIAANQSAVSNGDPYSSVKVMFVDGVATILCGLAGGVIVPVVFAVHGAYRATGARSSYTWWTAALLLAVTVGGLLPLFGDLFPWSILAALISFVAVSVGRTALQSTAQRYHGALLLAFMIPGASVVVSAVTAALGSVPASASPATLDLSIHWSSLQAMSNGSLLLVLIIAGVLTHMIDRRFVHACAWCLAAATAAWFGLIHGAHLGWAARPAEALGWSIAAIIMYTARWWSPAPAESGSPNTPSDEGVRR